MDVGGSTFAAVRAIADPGGYLAQAGWWQTGQGVYATASGSYPGGLGVVSIGTVLGTIDGVLYQVGAAGPLPTILVGDVLSVPVALAGDGSINSAASAANFAACVQLFSQWNAVITPVGGFGGNGFNLNLTAKLPGPAANYSAMASGAGMICAGLGGACGGAWQWKSAFGLYGAQIGVTLIAPPLGSSLNNLQIVLAYPGGTTYTWTMAARARYQFWVDDYSLCFWLYPADDVSEDGDSHPDSTFFYAGVPRQCALDYGASAPTVGYAFTHWDPARALAATYYDGPACLNGYAGTFDTNFALAVPVANGMEIDGKGANDPVPSGQQGLPIVIPARLALPFAGVENGVMQTDYFILVGWPFDAMVATAQYPLGSIVQYDGHHWIAMLAQAGATMFLNFDITTMLVATFECDARAGAKF